MQTLSVAADYMRAALLAASNEETRYNLCGVHVVAKGRKVWIEATDGHIGYMAYQEIDPVEGEAPPEIAVNIIIPTDAVKAALKAAGRAPSVELVIDGALHRLGSTIFTPIDGTFPDLARVVPKATSGEVAAFNPHYLSKIADMFGFAKKRAVSASGCYQLHMNGSGPALCLCEKRPNELAVIMPWLQPCPTTAATAPSWAHALGNN
ncbi:MAG: hypothetical protein HC850_14425 [Rhodomicrobium sp.]|nr:hypothetical protein [Rhodomicrobium sp.]